MLYTCSAQSHSVHAERFDYLQRNLNISATDKYSIVILKLNFQSTLWADSFYSTGQTIFPGNQGCIKRNDEQHFSHKLDDYLMPNQCS